MHSARSLITLADWRRRVAAMYAAVRAAEPGERAQACARFRRERDALFRDHPNTPLAAQRAAGFEGLPWFAHDPALRVCGKLSADVEPATLELDLPEGTLVLEHVAQVAFALGGRSAELGLYWVTGYGGGLFLPFADATSGRETYGGGRYLLDTIKGADLGSAGDALVLDFNYAYNPSCAYDDRWHCPLPPAANRLPFPVRGGERTFR